jgi:hemin uptake protein HemP
MNAPTSSPQTGQEPQNEATLPSAAGAELPVLPSATLLRGQKAVAIDHNGSLYRLQTTRQGKLILTK